MHAVAPQDGAGMMGGGMADLGVGVAAAVLSRANSTERDGSRRTSTRLMVENSTLSLWIGQCPTGTGPPSRSMSVLASWSSARTAAAVGA
jgi:hypothetical protein